MDYAGSLILRWLTNAIITTPECMHRAGQRCFELLALIGSPQLSPSKVFPAEQTYWPNWQTLWACTEADA